MPTEKRANLHAHTTKAYSANFKCGFSQKKKKKKKKKKKTLKD